MRLELVSDEVLQNECALRDEDKSSFKETLAKGRLQEKIRSQVYYVDEGWAWISPSQSQYKLFVQLIAFQVQPI